MQSNQQNDKGHEVIGNSHKWQSLTPVVLTRHPKFHHNGDKKLIPNTCFQVDGAEHQALKLLTHLFKPDAELALTLHRAFPAWLH